MQKQSILLQSITLDEIIKKFDSVENALFSLSQNLTSRNFNDELLSRKDACELLQIDSSTLWHWTNKGKVKAYSISNRRYYKRSELIDCLTPVKTINNG
ncbi:helix-turn-helix protein [Winogradskyella pacifica]|uniref:Helix-turn-helix protein n=1 Tax=Winogradskyella pacifica TaxID=664642 RepID=A0A3D9N1H0_9FLAO|nr:helix-turn-helix domain-containing protein [Winogradskyella pacifica]REE24718.1 helix-turn-helix protein [Winogradskyella pacifica]